MDARLAYLAVQYHLSRPGAELQRETGLPVTHGLAEVRDALQPQIDNAVASIELDDDQRDQLVSGIAGSMNELKAAPLLAAGGRQSMVPAFRDALESLFPSAAEDPEEATQLAGHMLQLRRRLEQLPREPSQPGEAQTKHRSRWRFWERK
jgi:hypothetical protein